MSGGTVIFSDIHGDLDSLQKIISFCDDNEIKDIYFLGDVLGYGAQWRSVATALKNYNILGVLGNHDFYALSLLQDSSKLQEFAKKYGASYVSFVENANSAEVDYFKSLPLTRSVEINGSRTLLCHGSPSDPIEGRIYPNTPLLVDCGFLKGGYDLVLSGQTHCRMDRVCNDVRFVNPGSASMARDGKSRSFCFINNLNEFRFIDID